MNMLLPLLILVLATSVLSLEIISPIAHSFETPTWLLSIQDYEPVEGELIYMETEEDFINSDLTGKIVFVQLDTLTIHDSEEFYKKDCLAVLFRENYYYLRAGKTALLKPGYSLQVDFENFAPMAFMSGKDFDELVELYEENNGNLIGVLHSDDQNPHLYEMLWMTQVILIILFSSVVLIALYRIGNYFYGGGKCSFVMIIFIMPLIATANIIRLIHVIVDPYFKFAMIIYELQFLLITVTWPLSLLVILLIALFWEELLHSSEGNAFLVKYRKPYLVFCSIFFGIIVVLALLLGVAGNIQRSLSFMIIIILYIIMMLTIVGLLIYYAVNTCKVCTKLEVYSKNTDTKNSIILISCSAIGFIMFLIGAAFTLLGTGEFAESEIPGVLHIAFQQGGLAISDLFLCLAFAEKLKKKGSSSVNKRTDDNSSSA